MSRVCVCGGRDYNDYDALSQRLDSLKITEIIHGACSGADSLAQRYGEERGIPTHSIPANWSKLGRAAGPIRNANLLNLNPDVVVAFPGGKGTNNMIKQAEAKQIKVLRVMNYE